MPVLTPSTYCTLPCTYTALVPPEKLQSTVVKWHTQATCWVSDSPFGMGVRAVVSSFTTLPTGPAGTHALIPVAR